MHEIDFFAKLKWPNSDLAEILKLRLMYKTRMELLYKRPDKILASSREIQSNSRRMSIGVYRCSVL